MYFAQSSNRTFQNFEKDVHVWDNVDVITVKHLIIVIYSRRTFVALFPESTAAPVNAHTIILQPLYGSTCVSQHPQLKICEVPFSSFTCSGRQPFLVLTLRFIEQYFNF